MKGSIDDADVRALFVRLRNAVEQPRPLLETLGEHFVETTKMRFDTSTAPDGSYWAPNTSTTHERYLARFRGSFDKSGRLSKAGAGRAAGKRPLIGETRALSTTINWRAGSDYVDIGSPMIYARVMQEGAAARSFAGGRTPWADIPARQFLGLSADDERFMIDATRRHLRDAAEGR